MKCYPLGPVSPRFTAIASGTGNLVTPIVLTTSSPHGLSSTDVVTISGVTGNTNANGTYAPGSFSVTATTITLPGVTGNGAYGGTGIASAPQQLISWFKFPVIPGVTDNSKLLVARMLFTAAPAGTAALFLGAAGLNQATFANVFRGINPPPTTGIYDYYDLTRSNNVIPIAEYWVDAKLPGTEAPLVAFWIK